MDASVKRTSRGRDSRSNASLHRSGLNDLTTLLWRRAADGLPDRDRCRCRTEEAPHMTIRNSTREYLLTAVVWLLLLAGCHHKPVAPLVPEAILTGPGWMATEAQETPHCQMPKCQ